MSCNPYAIFGFGDFSLPPCPNALEDPTVIAASPRLAALDPLTLGICDRPREEIDSALAILGENLTRLGATDARFDPRQIAPASGAADYVDWLDRRFQALLACRSTARSSTLSSVASADDTALAVALINSGQLTLGPDAFQSPAARAALAAGLAAQAAGGMTMASPFSFAGVGGPVLTTLPSTFNPFQGFTGGNVIDAVGGALPSLINIGGQYFLQQQALKAQEDAAKRQIELLRLQLMAQQTQMQPAMLGFAQGDPLGGILGGMSGMGLGQGGVPTTLPPIQGPSWIGVGGGCGRGGSVSVSPADAPGIYRTSSCSGAVSTRSRFFALRPDGTRDLFVKVGKVQSVAPRTLNRFARRWAKEAGLVAAKRGAGGRGRRRPR